VKCRHVFELDNGINQQSSNVYAHSAEFQFCRAMEAPAWMGKCPYMIYCCRLQWKDICIRRLYLQTSLQTSDPDLYIRLLVCCCQKEITKKKTKKYLG
jgi:hypothetical protein